jgi:hypothetical protein
MPFFFFAESHPPTAAPTSDITFTQNNSHFSRLGVFFFFLYVRLNDTFSSNVRTQRQSQNSTFTCCNKGKELKAVSLKSDLIATLNHTKPSFDARIHLSRMLTLLLEVVLKSQKFTNSFIQSPKHPESQLLITLPSLSLFVIYFCALYKCKSHGTRGIQVSQVRRGLVGVTSGFEMTCVVKIQICVPFFQIFLAAYRCVRLLLTHTQLTCCFIIH